MGSVGTIARSGGRRRPRGRAGACLLVAAGLTAAGTPADDRGRGAPPKVRGIVISTHTSGHEWGGDTIGPTMREIRDVGATWVSTHPYAAVRADGSIRFRESDPAEPSPALVRPIREAHRLGMRILIKPHLAYWGSPFAWRGEIEFATDEQWQRFWSDYERWIVAVARSCRAADGFVVGTELDRTLGHEEPWRRIIARVREQTGATLTYAANWSDYRRVPFWDALDAIGIQAYFPLVDGEAPGRSELEHAWARRMRELRAYSEAHDRPVLFTELGYSRWSGAAERPWESRDDGPTVEPFQATLLDTALRAIEAERTVLGVFLWKWFPNPRPVGRDFQLATPRLRQTIAEVWTPWPTTAPRR